LIPGEGEGGRYQERSQIKGPMKKGDFSLIAPPTWPSSILSRNQNPLLFHHHHIT